MHQTLRKRGGYVCALLTSPLHSTPLHSTLCYAGSRQRQQQHYSVSQLKPTVKYQRTRIVYYINSFLVSTNSILLRAYYICTYIRLSLEVTCVYSPRDALAGDAKIILTRLRMCHIAIETLLRLEPNLSSCLASILSLTEGLEYTPWLWKHNWRSRILYSQE